MIRDPKDLKRYDPAERANHWVVGISGVFPCDVLSLLAVEQNDPGGPGMAVQSR